MSFLEAVGLIVIIIIVIIVFAALLMYWFLRQQITELFYGNSKEKVYIKQRVIEMYNDFEKDMNKKGHKNKGKGKQKARKHKKIINKNEPKKKYMPKDNKLKAVVKHKSKEKERVDKNEKKVPKESIHKTQISPLKTPKLRKPKERPKEVKIDIEKDMTKDKGRTEQKKRLIEKEEERKGE